MLIFTLYPSCESLSLLRALALHPQKLPPPMIMTTADTPKSRKWEAEKTLTLRTGKHIKGEQETSPFGLLVPAPHSGCHSPCLYSLGASPSLCPLPSLTPSLLSPIPFLTPRIKSISTSHASNKAAPPFLTPWLLSSSYPQTRQFLPKRGLYGLLRC